jgi:uncharacterized membrane protein
MHWREFAVLAPAIVFVGGLFWWLPRMRRGRLYFGVTTDASFPLSPEGRRLSTQYRLAVTGLCFAALAVSAAALQTRWSHLPGGVVLLQAFGSLAAWSWAWSRTRKHAAPPPPPPVRVASLESEEEPLALWLTAALAPLTMLLAAGLYLYSVYDTLPQRYPVHWNASGAADAFAVKSLRTVFFGSTVGTGVLLLLALNVWMLLVWTRRGPDGRRSWSARFLRANLRMLVILCWGLGLLFSAVSVVPVLPANWSGGVFLAALVLPLALIAVTMLPMMKLAEEPTEESDKTPDECWKLGFVYFNREDPALVVPKRAGLGYSFNFAHPQAWGLIGAMIFLAAGPLLLML